MIVSDKRREANRRNALKSTGPKTQEGKDRSRENALKHGLTALVVVPEDAETFQQAAKESFWSLRPQNTHQAELVEQVALINVRTRRAQRIERRLRDQVSLRAVTSWDDDRRLEAERVGRDLSARPSEVVALLRRTPQGCDWLIERWAMLANLADKGDAWPGDRGRLAFDLLGTPPELRVGNPGATIDDDGHSIDEGDDRAAVARAQIAAIRESREVAAEHDAIARGLAEADLTDETTPEIRRLRRYEAALHRRLRWCLAALKEPVPTNRPPLYLEPDYNPQSEEEYQAEAQAELDAKAEAEVKLQAEYDARARAKEEAEAKAREKAEARKRSREKAKAQAPNEAIVEAPNEAIIEPEDESGSPIGFPASADDRREARLRQAEARREAKKRKLDRRRA